MIIRKGRQDRKKGWFESWIDDTTFIEKIVYIIWCVLPYGLFIMLDFIPNILIRLLSISSILSLKDENTSGHLHLNISLAGDVSL